jgi:enoyl-[acyl-carrier protein] reductase I
MALLADKKAVVFGVANDHSIAWAIAQALHREGAELALTYVGEAIERRVRPLAESLGVRVVLPCDVTKDDEIAAAFAAVKE